MSNEATDFLKKIAFEQGFLNYTNLSGDVIFADNGDKIGDNTTVYLSSGSVYCFFAIETEQSDIKALFEETKRTVNAIDVSNKVYPLYWGKGLSALTRISDHVKFRAETSTNKNAELEKIKALRKFRVIFGCIYVSCYDEFEKLLHEEYPPLVGSSKTGKGTGAHTIIMN